MSVDQTVRPFHQPSIPICQTSPANTAPVVPAEKSWIGTKAAQCFFYLGHHIILPILDPVRLVPRLARDGEANFPPKPANSTWPGYPRASDAIKKHETL